jgi:hypothetical protein
VRERERSIWALPAHQNTNILSFSVTIWKAVNQMLEVKNEDFQRGNMDLLEIDPRKDSKKCCSLSVVSPSTV